MDKPPYWDILDQQRLGILPLLKSFKDDFYLAGGTALALQIGHRDSVDFDFFCSQSFDTQTLGQKIEAVFADHNLVKTQEEKDTLTIVVDNNVKISFFAYPYKLVEPLSDEENVALASINEIGAMKLSAVISRPALKDYVDLYFILHQVGLDQLLALAKEKFPAIDTNLILKSLVYFEDIVEEPILFKHGHETDTATIKKHLADTVTSYLKTTNGNQ